jgi:hypothetical protein
MLRLAASAASCAWSTTSTARPRRASSSARLTRTLLEGHAGASRPPRSRGCGGERHLPRDRGGQTTWCGFARAIFEARAAQSPASRSRRGADRRERLSHAGEAAGELAAQLREARGALGARIGDWRAGLEEVLSALPA